MEQEWDASLRVPFFMPSESSSHSIKMEDTLEKLIDHYMNLGLYRNSTFLAERLFAAGPSAEHLHLLASCHMRSSHPQTAYRLLLKEMSNYTDPAITPKLRYLFAQSCLALNKLREGEAALVQGTPLANNNPYRCADFLMGNCTVPNGSAGLYLLGVLCANDNRREHAVAYLSLALKMDPYCWDAYERLCALGVNAPPGCFFGSDNRTEETQLSTLPIIQLIKEKVLPSTSKFDLKVTNGAMFSLDNTSAIGWPTVIPRAEEPEQEGAVSASRRNTAGENYQSVNNQEVRVFCGGQKGPPDDNEDNLPESIDGAKDVLKLLHGFGRGMRYLSAYRCTEALAAFDRLSLQQQNTGWVIQQKGKAHFEMANYRGARAEFEKMRTISPERTHGIELYSTNLWHMKDEVALCYLAQEALDQDKTTPEPWCAIGNCFSLQKEHDVAIKFFQRALQIDPSFTYAYTLCGHEYVSNENFEKAIAYYRHAIRSDPRHYNAWYGLGTIYYRQEKYDLAEYHFKRAISINPRSSVLYCYLGMVLHANQNFNDALRMLLRASELEPSNPQAKFQRALVLRSMEQYEDALIELEAVKDFAPREASVHSLMGKICKQLDRKDEALIHFTTALDLDPKDSNLMKLAIDRLDSPDVDESDDLG